MYICFPEKNGQTGQEKVAWLSDWFNPRIYKRSRRNIWWHIWMLLAGLKDKPCFNIAKDCTGMFHEQVYYIYIYIYDPQAPLISTVTSIIKCLVDTPKKGDNGMSFKTANGFGFYFR